MERSFGSTASLAGSAVTTATTATTAANKTPSVQTFGALLAPPSNRMMRSPSRESVISNVSLVSLSSYGSELVLQRAARLHRHAPASSIFGAGNELFLPGSGGGGAVPSSTSSSLTTAMRNLKLSSSKNLLTGAGTSSSTLLRCQSTTIPQLPRTSSVSIGNSSGNRHQPNSDYSNSNNNTKTANFNTTTARGAPSKHYHVIRSFSFSNITTQNQRTFLTGGGNCRAVAHTAGGGDALYDGGDMICAISNPSLSLASDFDDGEDDDDFTMGGFIKQSAADTDAAYSAGPYVEVEESSNGAFKLIVNSPCVSNAPANINASSTHGSYGGGGGDQPDYSGNNNNNNAFINNINVVRQHVAGSGGERGKKLRHRIKRKFLKLSLNDLWWKRGSGASGAKKMRQLAEKTDLALAGPQQKFAVIIPENKLPTPLISALLPTVVKALEQRHQATSEVQQPHGGLTERDVEREQGRLMSRYERNLQIFDWLHDLEEQSYEANRSIIASDNNEAEFEVEH